MYVVTGASGHTGRLVAERLLTAKKQVRVIGRSAERLKPLTDRGAESSIGDLTEVEKLTEAFDQADAVYAMIPPDLTAKDYRAQQDRISEALTAAIRRAGVKHVVTLSSFGADKPSGTGPAVGLHIFEQKLNQIPRLNALHLRPGYFMENTLAQIGIIKTMGIVAGPLRADLKIPMIYTRDIGEYAAEALLELDFSGHETRELLGAQDATMAEAASIIGKEIGKPDLSYLQPPDHQVRPALLQTGMTENSADLILEMSRAMNSGHMAALEPRSKQNTTPTTYEQFVREVFVPQFKGKQAAA